MLWGIVFAAWLVFALIRARKADASFSADFRTLKTGRETFRVDWATGIVRELHQATERYRPVAQELSPTLGGPARHSSDRDKRPDLGVRYHNVSETFVLEYPGGRLPFTFKVSQGAVGHYYFSEREGKRLTAIWLTEREQSTGKLLSLRTELEGKKYDAPIEHPALIDVQMTFAGVDPIGLVPALGLGWILGSRAGVLDSGFLAGVLGAVVVAVVYFIAASRIVGGREERLRAQLSALRDFVGTAHAAPLDPSTAPSDHSASVG